MNTYVLVTSATGTSPGVIAQRTVSEFQPFQKIASESLTNPTFQVVSSSAVSGSVEITLNNSDYSELFTFSSTSQSSKTVVYNGLLLDFRVVVSSISGTLKVIMGV